MDFLINNFEVLKNNVETMLSTLLDFKKNNSHYFNSCKSHFLLTFIYSSTIISSKTIVY